MKVITYNHSPTDNLVRDKSGAVVGHGDPVGAEGVNGEPGIHYGTSCSTNYASIAKSEKPPGPFWKHIKGRKRRYS